MRTHKRASGVPPSPVTLAEWVNGGFCPPKALHEVGRLFIDLEAASQGVKFGTDVRWDLDDYDYRPALFSVEVNAGSIVFRWRAEEPRIEWDDYYNPSVAEWLDSMPLEERPVSVDWNDQRRRVKRNYRLEDSSLDELVDWWNATPETMRPSQFPLDPVVGALVGSRVSLRDYLPTFQRYQQDVRRTVARDEG